MDRDLTQDLQQQVEAHFAAGTPLAIGGSGSKAFLNTTPPAGEAMDVTHHRGIVSYEPTELVITARAGTPLSEIEAALAEHGQCLPFEPPHFGPGATLGGTLACALSGPARPYTGAARDFVLGARIINGRGEVLRFGGEVMKNVAGYDLARLMVGARGTLGVILEASLKVLPAPASQLTLAKPCSQDGALEDMTAWAGQALPVSATCHDGEQLYVRLSGAETAVAGARRRLGGEAVQRADFWQRVREHTHGFFSSPRPLWRLSLPPAAPGLNLPGKTFLDWGGAQRWLSSDAPAEVIRRGVAEAGGHATLFRNGPADTETYHPLGETLLALHRNTKAAMDPQGILNPGQLYRGL